MQLGCLQGIPLIRSGDCLADAIATAADNSDYQPQPGDILVVAQKIVSKAEGRLVALSEVTVSAEAKALAAQADKDPRLAQLILDESKAVLRVKPGVIVVEHRLGTILANAGIDGSKIAAADSFEQLLLWPVDPDASAEALSKALSARWGIDLPVIINDSIGRAWRMGTVGHAIGCYGIDPLWNQVGDLDLFDKPLRVTEVASADAIAAAACLVQGEGREGTPVVWVRGCPAKFEKPRGANALLRRSEQDMFR